ncbi:MAG: hypothetical protein R3C05_06655 [Pirellulaceae bacterium]
MRHANYQHFVERLSFLNDEQASPGTPPQKRKSSVEYEVVNGDKLLEAKLRRNDLCPCGSSNRI